MASSRTAGREDRKVEIFCRAKTSCCFQCVERAKWVAMRLFGVSVSSYVSRFWTLLPIPFPFLHSHIPSLIQIR